ncbi:MAG: GntR family transcriptional regulator [Actinomycetota bacterium]
MNEKPEGAEVENEGWVEPGSGGVFSARHDRRKVTDWVYEEVRGAIIDLRLKPGEPLREAAMADQLGVSKTPVREAFTRLEREGLVETTSFKGAVVTGYAPEDLRDIYELRELLEGAAARAAAGSASVATLAQLAQIVEQSRQLRADGEITQLAELLGRFDVVVYDQVTNQRVRALIENLQAHLARIGKLTEDIPGRVEASVEEHARIVEAIAAGDPGEAELRMRAHIRSVMNDQLEAGAPAAETSPDPA